MKDRHVTRMEKTVGYVSDGTHCGMARVTIRFTADRAGDTLSLEDGKTLIHVKYDDVLKLAKEAHEALKKAEAGM